MGKASDPPPGPDYAALIPQQTAANKDVFNTMLNASRANQITPFGSSTWTFTPSGGGGGTPTMRAPAPAAPPPPAPTSIPGVHGPATGMHSEWDPNGGGQIWVPNAPSAAPPPPPLAAQAAAGGGGGGGMDLGSWTNTITLSPEQQRLYDQNVQAQLKQGNLLSGLADASGAALKQPFSLSGAPGLVSSLQTSKFQDPTFANGLTGGQDFSQQAADSIYNLGTRYMDPQQKAQQRALESRLGEQGFVPGTPAYQQAMGEFQQNRDLAYADARDRAITQGYNVGNQFFQNQLQGRNLQRQQTFDANTVANQLFGQKQAAGQFQNNARNQYIANLLTQRQTPLNEYNAVRAGTQIQPPNTQSTFATPNLQGVDLLGAANQGYMNQIGGYNAQVGSQNGLLNLLGSLGGAAMGGGGSSLLSNLSGLIGLLG